MSVSTLNSARQTSVYVLAVLGMIGSFVFLLTASDSGFRIPTLLFALPAVAILGTLAMAKFRLVPTRRSGVLGETWFLLTALVVVSGVLRLLVAHYASYYPDEYGTWEIATKNPWSNIFDFLHNYDKLPVGCPIGCQNSHPPLGFLLMAVGYQILPSLEGPRLVSVALALISIPIVYLLLSLIFDKENALLGSAVYALLPQTIVFLSLALTDTYVFFFGVTALAAFISAVKREDRRGRSLALLASGLFLGLAFWSKLGIPLLWALTILLSAIFLKSSSRRERFLLLAGCYVIGSAVLAGYYLAAPVSFFLLIFHTLIIPQVAFGKFISYPNVGSITVFPTTEGKLPISYLDLLTQLPAWFTPLALLAGLLGIFSVARRKDLQVTWVLLWGLAPLLVLIPYYRDIRYLLVSSIPLAIFAMIGYRQFPRIRREYFMSIILVFLVVGSISFIPIVQQEYAGVGDASAVLIKLGLSDQVILTNALEIRLYLPRATLLYLSSDNSTPASMNPLFNGGNVSAVVLLHQRRGAWPLPTPAVIELIRGYFTHRISGGPSGYSWYEILYSPVKSQNNPTSVWFKETSDSTLGPQRHSDSRKKWNQIADTVAVSHHTTNAYLPFGSGKSWKASEH